MFLVCGMPGSGKSTLARRLAAEHAALHLDPDAWIIELGLDPHDPLLRARFEALQWDQAQDLLRLGTSVVIENASWTRANRDRRLATARELGARAELHVLDVPLEERWRRIVRRNDVPGAVRIDREQLERFERAWQAPSEDELAAYDAASLTT